VRLEDDDEENADECEYDEESADCDEEVKTVHKPVSAKVSRETDTDEEPVYLEDNRIDQEIKTDKFASQPAKPVKFAEALLPPIDILKMPPPRDNQESKSDLSQRSAFLIKTLDEFGIKATVIDIVEGPAVSRFEIKPAPGVKVSRITTLIDDIALALAAPAIRIEAPIPGKSALGIEIPNTKPTPVYFYDLLKNENFGRNQIPLNLALGVTINGKPVFADLSEMPHLLIAGSTGSGKSVCVNTIIASILFQARADQVKFVMIDPKMVELSSYNGIPHLIAPVVTDPAKASAALMWAVEEMTRRYEILAGCGCKKISTYNEELERLKQEVDQDLEPMPFIVIVIDELADLMMTASAEVEGSICRLAQMARAVGMHLVIATQRPSVNVLTGLIKANLPTRIAFSVTSAVDSRTILDAKGAERLLGKGDMLFIPKGRNKPLRLQGAFVSDRELMDLIEFVKKQGQPEYMDIAPTQSDDDEDDCSEEEAGGDADSPLIQQILKYLETQEKTSTSMLQRKFRIGYNRAARIMDQLEEKGLVSPMDGANKRRVLIGRSNTQV
jgi:S-DNA-T family DNA segregation ATPase FtsK/SpoIIIE